MAVSLRAQSFDPYQELQRHEARLNPGSVGAVATFIGTMRDFNEGDDVVAMTLEHYPEMTERQLERVIERAREQWPIIEALIIHRIGDITPGQPIVLTAIWSAHRAAAFDACRFLMESLKSDAPFWKKEMLADHSTRWVTSNTPGFSR